MSSSISSSPPILWLAVNLTCLTVSTLVPVTTFKRRRASEGYADPLPFLSKILQLRASLRAMANTDFTPHSASIGNATYKTDRRGNGVHKRDVPRYKHVLAIHKADRTSYLTQGSPAAPSFVGFRNLMVLVIGTRTLLPESK